MSITAMRWLSALLLAYALSRVTWRIWPARRGPARLIGAHAASAAMLAAACVGMRQSLAPVLPLLGTQLLWFLLDRARGRAARAPASRPAG